MRKNYDFSKGQKNPYAKKLRRQKLSVQPDVQLTLNDILDMKPQQKLEADLRRTIKMLEKRVTRLEAKLKR